MSRPLEGVRVVELADYVSAPASSRILADMGADVIKIEQASGNVWRRYTIDHNPAKFSEEVNPSYDVYNTGKRHIVLNLKTTEGMELFHRLLATSDVFVTNLRVRALKRLGLDWESLKDKYPTLVYGLLLGYGEKGPDADIPAFDNTAFWARTGLLLGMAPRYEPYHPSYPPFSAGDIFTGMTLAAEVCSALFNRTKTGKGDYVRSSLFHNGIFAVSSMQIMTQKASGVEYPRSRASMGICSGDYECKDGKYLYWAAGLADKMLPILFSIAGKEELIHDARFTTDKARRANCEALHEIICGIMLSKTSEEWLKIAKEYDLPTGKIQNFSDVSEDEQALANGYIEDVVYPSGATFKVASSPIEMDSVGEIKTGPTVKIGANTIEVLKEIGLTEEELEKYKGKGIID
ncbi:MAG: CoA transferase [Ruminococcaceae bacterium]|nr:CoA transferase [Oscillospiraceae bacterium]